MSSRAAGGQETSTELLSIRLPPSVKIRWARYRRDSGLPAGEALDSLLRRAESSGLDDWPAAGDGGGAEDALEQAAALRFDVDDVLSRVEAARGRLASASRRVEEAEASRDRARASLDGALAASRRLRRRVVAVLDDAQDRCRRGEGKLWAEVRDRCLALVSKLDSAGCGA